MIYIIIVLLLLFLSYRFDYCGKNKNKDFWYGFIFVVLVLASGLRYRLGVDTSRYLYSFYHNTSILWNIKLEDFSIGEDPLFKLINSVVFTFGGRFYIVQIIHAFFVNGLIFTYFKKHSPYIFTCIFFYCIWMYFGYNMEEMRASMSVVICLFANDYIIEKKWLKGLLLYLVGCFFHVSTVAVIMMIPLLFFLKMNLLGYGLMIGAFVVGGIMMNLFEDYITLLEFSENVSNKAEYYLSRDDLSEQQGNILYYLIYLVPLVFYSIVSLRYAKKYSKDIFFLRLEPLIMIAILLLFLQMHINLVYRFVNFYAPYIIIFVAFYLINITQKQKYISNGVLYFKSLAICFYLILAIVYPYFKDITIRRRYFPYASVIDQSIDKERELIYSSFDGEGVHPNEY